MVKGILTDCWNGSESIVELEFEIIKGENGKIFRLIGGPTGYESFYIDHWATDLDGMKQHGWIACMGTEKRWDKLFIPADEMKKVLENV